MAKFLKKTLLCVVLTLISFASIRIYTITYRAKNYSSAFVDKLQLLAKYRSSRKIVLIGGSSVGFGISAELIEQQTGIKTINLGQHAGFGLTDFQDFILRNLTRDDIIIFSPEWCFYEDPKFVDEGTFDELINNNLNYGIVIGKPMHVLKSFFSPISTHEFSYMSMEKYKQISVPPYIYNCLNSNGDIVSHCNLKPVGPKRYKINVKHFNIKSFLETFPFVYKQRTIILFPPTQQDIYNNNKISIKNIESIFIKNRLTLLNHIESNVYPDSSFFNEEYHLTCQSRTDRTKVIIGYLRSNSKRNRNR